MKKDCFAFTPSYKGAPGCAVLNRTVCAREDKCPFYKTKKQADEDRAKGTARATAMGYYAGGAEYTPKN